MRHAEHRCENSTDIAAFSNVTKMDNLLEGVFPHMTSSNIVNLQIVASGRIIDQLNKELYGPEVVIERGPMHFSVGHSEWVNIAAVSTGGLSFVAAVLVAYINGRNNKRVRVVFNDGPVKEIEAPNQKELIELLGKIKRLEIEN